MSLDVGPYAVNAATAIRQFWQSRSTAHQLSQSAGFVNAGERSSVTAGKHLDGFVALAADLVQRNGLEAADIATTQRLLTLPGYFRPSKMWDMLVVADGILIAALEFKSQVGPSFGNNFNNRTEEALGSAIDIWTAYREGAFGLIARPFVGWFMLIEDCQTSRMPVRDALPRFPLQSVFAQTSYIERYQVLGQKLVQEQLYTTATVFSSPRTVVQTGEYADSGPLTDLATFVSSFAGHIAAAAARRSSD